MQERAEHVAEWVRLTEDCQKAEREVAISSQLETKPGCPESGKRAAARELGLDKGDVHRAVKIAGITDEAKAAREAGWMITKPCCSPRHQRKKRSAQANVSYAGFTGSCR